MVESVSQSSISKTSHDIALEFLILSVCLEHPERIDAIFTEAIQLMSFSSSPELKQQGIDYLNSLKEALAKRLAAKTQDIES